MKIALRHGGTLEFTDYGAITRFDDGATWGALPHDTHDYHVIAHRCGYEDDTLRYCQEHELAHHVVAEAFGSPSLVLFALAHGNEAGGAIAAAEESLAINLQRYVRTNEHPMVDGFPWQQARDRFLGLLNPRDEGDVL